MPEGRLGFEFAYNFTDYKQNAFMCFNDSDTTLLVVANAGNCIAQGYQDPGNNTPVNTLFTDGIYTNSTHYGMGSITVRPTRRLTGQTGYSITSVGGFTQFHQLQPYGTLQYNYHQPMANLSVNLGHNLEAKAGWNYYRYGEKSFVGPTVPRYFHANHATLGLRWAF
jgi:hypothetical protein